MADINLLQNQLKDTTFLSSSRTKIVVWICFVLLLVVVAGGAALYLLTNKINAQVMSVGAENTNLQGQLSGQQQGLGTAQAFQAQLSNIDFLLKNHIYFSPLLNELGQYTYQNAQYSVFDVDQDTGKIHVEGNVDSYTGLGKLLLGLSTSPQFQGVTLLSILQAAPPTPGFSFAIDLMATPNAFKKSQ